MQIPLERSSEGNGRAVPVYQQIAAWVRAEIEAGRLGPGDRLPAIRALARSLAVNRDTVALAYEALARDGWLESTVGRGSFVRRPETAAEPAPFEPVLSPLVERLLDFERARAAGLPAARRDVFLDNVDSVGSIAEQFEKLKRVARAKGTAVGIGHVHKKHTLEVLMREVPRLENENIALVFASEVVDGRR
mgnify:CR=1 FL=1